MGTDADNGPKTVIASYHGTIAVFPPDARVGFFELSSQGYITLSSIERQGDTYIVHDPLGAAESPPFGSATEALERVLGSAEFSKEQMMSEKMPQVFRAVRSPKDFEVEVDLPTD